MNLFRRLSIILMALAIPVCMSAQSDEPADSLVRLVSADSLQSVEIRGVTFRKVVGRPARFLHNNTYLLCDTALWNVNTHVIDAKGHVKILQEQTVLSSDNLQYFIDEDLAKFRGGLVQLTDKDHNTLRTNYLDYNTKDSVAVFKAGAAMRDKDGQLIESIEGTYDSKIKTFEFVDLVNMFTDSVFVKTSYLKYESDSSLATFGSDTNAWKDDNMLSADAGWYNRDRELFFFRRGVHVMSDTQEGWCDTLYFDRNSSDIFMKGNAQVTDTSRSVSAMAGRIDYIDSVSLLTMTIDPVIVAEMDENNQKDTVYFGADSLVYYKMRHCDVPKWEFSNSGERVKSIDTDPVTEYRRKSAEEAAKAAAEAAAEDPNNPETAARNAEKARAEAQKKAVKPKKKPVKPGSGQSEPTEEAIPDGSGSGEDGKTGAEDAEGTAMKPPESGKDSPSKAAADSIKTEAVDTTELGFVVAVRNVRMFRKTMQLRCDSLRYCDIDSLACLYVDPVIWNEGNHQYNADSIYVVIKNEAMEKASLMSDAFIHIEEDTLHYDQIRGAEMTAFFGDDGELARFDALGNASALFYIEENDALATVNKKDSKMLSAYFSGGNIQKIYYYDSPKSDAYPVVQMKDEDRMLKGFKWDAARRPKDRYDITEQELRSPQRFWYNKVPRAEFRQTEKYFPGYMDEVYAAIARSDSIRTVREQQRNERESVAIPEPGIVPDSLAVSDTVSAPDSLSASGVGSVPDSLSASGVGSAPDSLSVPVHGKSLDNLAVTGTASASDSISVSTPVSAKAGLAVPADSEVSSSAADSTAAAKPVRDVQASHGDKSETEVKSKEKELVQIDSLKTSGDQLKSGRDSLESRKDALKAQQDTLKAQREALKAQRDTLRAEKMRKKQEKLDAKWAELDAKDKEKAAAKADKKLQTSRENKRKALLAARKQEEKDSKFVTRYVEKYQKKKARKDARAGRKKVSEDSEPESPEDAS